MRRLLGAIGVIALMSGGVAALAPAVPAAASIRCIQVSPNTTAGSCTYRSTAFEHETLSAFTVGGWSLDWVENGQHRSIDCTSGSCRNEPGLAFTADAGTIIHVTVTKGLLVVRQVVVAGRSI